VTCNKSELNAADLSFNRRTTPIERYLLVA